MLLNDSKVQIRSKKSQKSVTILKILRLFLVNRGRQRCRARLIAVILGAEGIYSKESGPNEGVYHVKVSSITSFGRLIVKMLSRYWIKTKKVIKRLNFLSFMGIKIEFGS